MVVLEDLKVRNITRSAKGALDELGTSVATKSGLNKSILDAGWSALAQTIRFSVKLKAPALILFSCTQSTSHAPATNADTVPPGTATGKRGSPV